VLPFGLVAIPVETHTATKSEKDSVNPLHQMRVASAIGTFAKCAIRIVDRGQLVRGYEVAKGEYVQLTDAEPESSVEKSLLHCQCRQHTA
jgi:non-homologous end joining protein Ku